MQSVRQAIASRGGLAATFELTHDGFGRGAVRAALEGGHIFRVRQGWYAIPGLTPDEVRAARVGGRLTCHSGLRTMGCWDVGDPDLHVVVDPRSARLRRPDDKWARLSGHSDDVRVHWRVADSPGRLTLPALECFRDAATCLTREQLPVVADSFLHLHPSARTGWQHAAALLGPRASVLRLADGVCESGTETIFFDRFRDLAPRRQVVIPGVGRVDFLLGERLITEVDGSAHHSGPEQFEADRRRDALLSARGFRVLRFSYRQVTSRWFEVEASVRAAIARGDRY